MLSFTDVTLLLSEVSFLNLRDLSFTFDLPDTMAEQKCEQTSFIETQSSNEQLDLGVVDSDNDPEYECEGSGSSESESEVVASTSRSKVRPRSR